MEADRRVTVSGAKADVERCKLMIDEIVERRLAELRNAQSGGRPVSGANAVGPGMVRRPRKANGPVAGRLPAGP